MAVRSEEVSGEQREVLSSRQSIRGLGVAEIEEHDGRAKRS